MGWCNAVIAVFWLLWWFPGFGADCFASECLVWVLVDLLVSYSWHCILVLIWAVICLHWCYLIEITGLWVGPDFGFGLRFVVLLVILTLIDVFGVA